MSLVENLVQEINTNKLLLNKTHEWLWSHTTHARFREQSAKYHALESYTKDLEGVLGFLAFMERFSTDVYDINICGVSYNLVDEAAERLLERARDKYQLEVEESA